MRTLIILAAFLDEKVRAIVRPVPEINKFTLKPTVPTLPSKSELTGSSERVAKGEDNNILIIKALVFSKHHPF